MSEIQYGRMPELEHKLKAIEAESRNRTLLRSKVGEEEIADVVSRWTGVPLTKMLEGDREKLQCIELNLKEKVVGQEDAITAVSNAIRRSRVGLTEATRPNGSFLFAVPTGVGKTELCKALSEFLFDSQEAMLRLDMSEFMEKHSVARLIGAPPGYVGYEEGGYLTEAVRRRPYSLLLLDEIEKAHPDVFNILLQILDEGRLTDSKGRTVDFRNTVIVMTSNLGSNNIGKSEEASGNHERINSTAIKAIDQTFRPEFINRIDEIIVFHPLGIEQIKGVTEIQLKLLEGRLLENGVKLKISGEVVDRIAVLGFDPIYGARSLKRVIQRELENPLAERLLSEDCMSGENISIEMKAGQVQFKLS